MLAKAGDLVDAKTSDSCSREWSLTTTGIKHVEDLLIAHFGALPKLGQPLSEVPAAIAEVRLLFLAVSPVDAGRLRLDVEHRQIQERIRAAKHRDSIKFADGWAVRPDDLFQLLHEHDPHIVHFCGHGTSLSELAFENQTGESKLVTGEALATCFDAISGDTRLVVLNACHSAEAAKQIAQHVDCAIGMADAILDATALQFAAALYRSIGFGKDMQQAYREARASLVMEGLAGDNIPQLFAKPGVDPASVVLAHEFPTS